MAIDPLTTMARIRALVRVLAKSQLRRNTLAGSAGAIAGVAISAISYPTYLYFLGYEQYGLWLAVSAVLSFATYGHLGLAPAVATTVAEEYARNDVVGIRRTVSTALVALTGTGFIAVALVLTFGVPLISAMHLRPALYTEALVLLPFAAILSLYVVQIDSINAILVGLGRLDLATGIQQVGRLLGLGVSIVLLISGLGLISLPIATLAGYVFVHVASLVFARRISGASCFRISAFSIAHLRGLLTFGSGVLTASVLSFLLGPLNKFALTRYLGPASVPVFDIAYKLTMQMRGLLEAGFRSLMPEVSRLRALQSEDGRPRIPAIHSRSMKTILIIGGPVFCTAIVLAPTVLQLWLGTRFRPELVTALRILLLGGFASLVGVPGYYMLLGARKLKHIVGSTALQAAVNTAGVIWLCNAGALSAVLIATAASAAIGLSGAYLLVVSRIDSCSALQHVSRTRLDALPT